MTDWREPSEYWWENGYFVVAFSAVTFIVVAWLWWSS